MRRCCGALRWQALPLRKCISIPHSIVRLQSLYPQRTSIFLTERPALLHRRGLRTPCVRPRMRSRSYSMLGSTETWTWASRPSRLMRYRRERTMTLGSPPLMMIGSTFLRCRSSSTCRGLKIPMKKGSLQALPCHTL